jgi:hypothetical protein
MNKAMRKTIYGIEIKHYLKAGRKKKGEIIDGVIRLMGINRKSVIRAFKRAQLQEPWTKFEGGKETYYTPDSIAALKQVWEAGNRCCGELLHGIIPEYVNIFKRDKDWQHTTIATEKLLQMSMATVKRNTTGWQCLGRKGISTTTPSSIKSKIPVFDGDWKKVEVGNGQIDTVAHCGTTNGGDYIFSCGYVDVPLGWIQYRGQWCKGMVATKQSLKEIQDRLPFCLKHLHPDCGCEFLNGMVIGWAEEEKIDVTRSRSYHKNDNGYIEQRNGHVIRRHLGYTRYDNKELLPLFNELLDLICMYHNHFVPQRLCVETITTELKKHKKVYEKVAVTPYQRLLSKNALTPDKLQELTKLHNSLNPKTMLDKIIKLKHTLATRNQKLRGARII